MRNLKTLAFAGLLGVFAMASDASACHKKKCACPAPAPVVYAPVVECAPVKKKCHMSMPKMTMPKLCHKKTAVCATPVAYAAPMSYTAPMASPQATAQRM